jgi:hypothetical protein
MGKEKKKKTSPPRGYVKIKIPF